ncbi:hypothetical protein SAMN05446589_4356 [Streptomyces sp. OV198]|nr:hypothetical protein SAMN05446589_4356 [Streptomyces sp. OV198]
MAEPQGEGQRETEDVWDDLVLDESFIRSAETTEPSARARMLAARWREGDPTRSPGAPTSRPRGGSSARHVGAGGAADNPPLSRRRPPFEGRLYSVAPKSAYGHSGYVHVAASSRRHVLGEERDDAHE